MEAFGSMEVSGKELFDQIVKLTGLPQHLVEQEMHALLKAKGLCQNTVTLETLREALLNYLAHFQNDAHL